MRVRCARRSVLALAALLLAVTGCRQDPERQHARLQVFGGEADIELAGVDPAQARIALDRLTAEFRHLHRDWHAWEPGALTALNQAIARGERSTPPASIRDLILRSQPLSIRSDGLFDPAVGGLIALWGFHTEHFPIVQPMPDPARIEAWRAGRPSIADVVVEGDMVWSLNPAVQLDFGGISEGVAAESAAQLLAAQGIGNALLTLGSDYYALGDADGQPWRAAVRDPYGGILGEVELRDHEALFTSGNYEKFRQAPNGARWAHVLDPRTGQPVTGSAAAAVLHRDPVLADIATTALMVGGPARFASLLGSLQVRCALLLTEENEIIITAAMQARIALRREPVRLGPALGDAGACD